MAPGQEEEAVLSGWEKARQPKDDSSEFVPRPRLAAASTNALSRALLGAKKGDETDKDKKRLQLQQAAAERATAAAAERAAAEQEKRAQEDQARRKVTVDVGKPAPPPPPPPPAPPKPVPALPVPPKEDFLEQRSNASREAYGRLEEKCRLQGPAAMTAAELQEMGKLKAALDAEGGWDSEVKGRQKGEGRGQGGKRQEQSEWNDDSTWWDGTWTGSTRTAGWDQRQHQDHHYGYQKQSQYQPKHQSYDYQQETRSQYQSNYQNYEYQQEQHHKRQDAHLEGKPQRQDLHSPNSQQEWQSRKSQVAQEQQPNSNFQQHIQNTSEEKKPHHAQEETNTADKQPTSQEQAIASSQQQRPTVEEQPTLNSQQGLDGPQEHEAPPGSAVPEEVDLNVLSDSADFVRALCFRKSRRFLLALEAELQRLLESPQGAVLRVPDLAAEYREQLDGECARYGVEQHEIEERGSWFVDIVATSRSCLPLPACAFIPGTWAGATPSKWQRLKQPMPAKMKQYCEMVMQAGPDLHGYDPPVGYSQLQLPAGAWQLVQEDTGLLEQGTTDGAVLSMQVEDVEALGSQRLGVALCSSGSYSSYLENMLDGESSRFTKPRDEEDPFVLLLEAKHEARCWLLEFGRASSLLDGRPQGRQAVPFPSHGSSNFWVASCPSRPEDSGRYFVEVGIGRFPSQRLFRVGLRIKDGGRLPQQFALAILGGSVRGAYLQEPLWLGTCRVEPGLCQDRAGREHLVAISDSSLEEESLEGAARSEAAAKLCARAEQRLESLQHDGSLEKPRPAVLIPRAPNMVLAVCTLAEEAANLCKAFNEDAEALQAHSLGCAPGMVPKCCELPADAFAKGEEALVAESAKVASLTALHLRQQELAAMGWAVATELGLSEWRAAAEEAAEWQEDAADDEAEADLLSSEYPPMMPWEMGATPERSFNKSVFKVLLSSN